MDKSGDFTKGANIKKEIAEEIFELLSADSIIRDKKTGVCTLAAGRSIFKIENDTYLEGLKEVDTILNYLGENKEVNIMSTDLSFEQDMINFQMDLSVVRDLEYYTISLINN